MVPSISDVSRVVSTRPRLSRWLPPTALCVAVIYCACGGLLLGHRALWPSFSNALLLLRLFVLAAVPIAAALACLWLEQAIGDPEMRRGVRALVLAAAAVMVVLLAGGAFA